MTQGGTVGALKFHVLKVATVSWDSRRAEARAELHVGALAVEFIAHRGT